MKVQGNPKLIGAFVIGAVALIIVVFIVFGSGRYFTDTFKYVIYFRGSVNGLKIGAPVKLRGVEFGSVTEITPVFDDAGDFYVEVIIETVGDVAKNVGSIPMENPQHEEVLALVEKGLRAQLAVQSMVLGQLYVTVDYFPNTPLNLYGFNDEYVEIPSVPTRGEEIELTVRRSLDKIGQIKVDEISMALLKTFQGIDSLVRSPQMERNLTALGVTLDEAAEMFDNLDDNMTKMTSQLVETTNQLNSAVARAEKLLTRLDKIAAEDRFELYTTLKELSGAARALRLLADHLERNPSDLIYGKD